MAVNILNTYKLRVIEDNLIWNIPSDDTLSPVKMWHVRRIYLTEHIASYAKRLQSYKEKLLLIKHDDSARQHRIWALEALCTQIFHEYDGWENLKQEFDNTRIEFDVPRTINQAKTTMNSHCGRALLRGRLQYPGESILLENKKKLSIT